MILAAAAANTDPGLPYQAIGVVLAALVTGVTAIVVALLQRNKPSAPAPPPTPSFSLSEAEWIVVRDRSVRTETLLQDLKEDYIRHEGSSNRNMLRLIEEVRILKGRQGTQ